MLDAPERLRERRQVVTGLPEASSAVTPTVNACPTAAFAGAVTLRSWTVFGAPFRNALSRFAVARWIRGSAYVYQ